MWRPVLFGADAARARALVATIALELRGREIDDASLADGHAGIALLHGYRAHAGDEDAADLAFAALERALHGMTAVPWLFRGHAGIGFAVQHLEVDASEALGEIDAAIARLLALERSRCGDAPAC